MARLGRAQAFAPQFFGAIDGTQLADVVALGSLSITGSATLTAPGSLVSLG